MPVAGHSFPRRENDLAAWWPMVAASMLGHVVIFVCLILAPLSSPETYAPPPHIFVDIDAIPAPAAPSPGEIPGPREPAETKTEPLEDKPDAPEPARSAEDEPGPVESATDPPEPAPPAEEKPEPVERVEPRETPETRVKPDMPPLLDRTAPIVKKPPPRIKKTEKNGKKVEPVRWRSKKPKRSLKKMTYRSSRVKDQAIEKIRKDIDESAAKSLESALDRIRRDVESTPAASEEPAAGVGHENGAPHGMGASSEIMAVYNAELAYRIRRNWAFSAQLADGRTDMEATISFRILRSGEIRDIVFEKKSGNAYLDDSAMRAVQKSDPLKPLPKAYLAPYYDVGLKFNEKGLKDRRGSYK